MCTVTYIPVNDRIFFTSNRDEKNGRSSALPPAAYDFGSGRMLFPKDSHAGGTWIAAHENRNVIVLLNGGWKAHVPKPPYRKSRGLILLDLLDHATPFNCFLAVNLNNIEPFTAVIYDNQHLFECRWDGEAKHSTELDPAARYIWSSCTLYDDEVISKRNSWFADWTEKNSAPEQEDIFNFHRFTGDGDKYNDLMMNRNDNMLTVSVTSVELSERGVAMEYLDTAENKKYSAHLMFLSSMQGK